MKIGAFFGSFNPIHIGHLIIANIMVETTDLDEVWFIVSPQNPFKNSNSLAHEFDRLDLVEAAIEGSWKLRASDVEFNMPRPSYTIDTLAHLGDKHPNKEFILIIGEDNLEHFHKWKNHDKILQYHGLYVYPRPHAKKGLYQDDPRVMHVDAPMVDISATFIRKMAAQGHSIRYLVPERVAEQISSRKLYSQG